MVRERATVAREFDPAELRHGHQSEAKPAIALAALPLVVVVTVNFLMSFLVLPRLDTAFLAEERWGATSLSAVAGVWAVVVALAAAILTLVLVNYRRLPALRESMDAGANASVLPALSVASLVGFGAVVAALPAFGVVRDWVLTIGGGPLVSLALATNVLAALTGSASGGLTIALDALGETYMRLAAELNIDPSLMHRVAVIGAGTLDGLPHNGAVVTLLAVCGSDHRQSYFDIVIVGNRRRPYRARRGHRVSEPCSALSDKGHCPDAIYRHVGRLPRGRRRGGDCVAAGRGVGAIDDRVADFPIVGPSTISRARGESARHPTSWRPRWRMTAGICKRHFTPSASITSTPTMPAGDGTSSSCKWSRSRSH